LSSERIHGCHRLLKQALKQAVMDNKLSRVAKVFPQAC